MNISEAITAYINDDRAENICNDTFEPKIKLICDRNTKRIYTISGYDFTLNLEHLSNNSWYVLKNS